MQASEIAKRLAEDAEGVCRHLLPNGKRDGSEWRAGSALGDAGQSLGVHLTGDKAGVWADFAAGGSGDLLDLWQEARGISLPEAMTEARSFLGISEPEFASGKARQVHPIDKPKVHTPRDAVAQWLEEERGLSQAALDAYRVAAQGDYVALPYRVDGDLVAVKYRSIHDKHDCRVTKGDAMPLFGWQAIPDDARSVVITEGEFDAVACYQMGYPALSVPNGAQGMTWIEVEYDRLERFDTIYLWMDSDEQGQKAVETLVDRLGMHRCRVVRQKLGKDANDALLKGLQAKDFIDRAETMDPAELRSADTYTEDVIREFYPPDDAPRHIRPPWQKAEGKIAFRQAELTIVAGANGHGKSQITNQIALDAMYQGFRTCIASMEMQPRRTLMRMVKQAAGWHSETDTPAIPYIRAIHSWLSDKLWLFAVTGTAKSERMLEVFEYAHKRYGINLFVIDSLAKCGFDEDDYNGQKHFVDRLADWKNRLGVHVILVAHPRKNSGEHEDTGKMDVRGSAAVTDMADQGGTIWRNKKKQAAIQMAQANSQEPDEETLKKPDAILFWWKNRNGTWEGQQSLWWHEASNQYLAFQKQPPKTYVDWSAARQQEATA